MIKNITLIFRYKLCFEISIKIKIGKILPQNAIIHLHKNIKTTDYKQNNIDNKHFRQAY